VLGSTLASLTLRLTFGGGHEHFFGTTPSGSYTQAVALEFIISFYLMFVVSGVATDDRAVSPFAPRRLCRLNVSILFEIADV
jgi:aquaporin NIP